MTVTSSSASSRWGTSTSRSTYSRGTGSSHTVCQMPDWAVYQMVPRSSRCLPRAWGPGLGQVADAHLEEVLAGA